MSRRGLTLVETLVAISVIALLLAIALPGLAASRRSARRAACLSNVRQSGLDILQHASSNDDLMPAPRRGETETYPGWQGFNGRPVTPSLFGYAQCGDLVARAPYMDWVTRWPMLLAAGGAAGGAAWTCSGHAATSAEDAPSPQWPSPKPSEAAAWAALIGAATPLHTAYWYSSAFLASPEFFISGQHRLDDFGPQRLANVRHPSAKVVLNEEIVHHRFGAPESPWRMTPPAGVVFFADGHAEHRDYTECLNTHPALTPEGILGRDF